MDIGIDEVGRGSLAGPLVIGAVALSKPINGLKDSKKLTPLQRQRIAKEVYAKAEAAALGWVWPHEIDELGLTKATTLAIERALSLISLPIERIIIDGKFNFLVGNDKALTVVGADNTVPSVSAASVIAKVARDEYMRHIDQYFPDYSFAKHVGYGTAEHLKAIASNGPCPLHRLSFRPLSYQED
ncbi:MAG TPA: ribonuclease HII [Candidatus Saccharimonadales bacterium]|jgi:ribonuclease HII